MSGSRIVGGHFFCFLKQCEIRSFHFLVRNQDCCQGSFAEGVIMMILATDTHPMRVTTLSCSPRDRKREREVKFKGEFRRSRRTIHFISDAFLRERILFPLRTGTNKTLSQWNQTAIWHIISPTSTSIPLANANLAALPSVSHKD